MYFTLKDPKSENKTLIYIRYYCKNSKRYFKFSTKLSINPEDWNFKSRMPITKRGLANVESRQLTHYLNILDSKLQGAIIKFGADLTVNDLKETFKPKENNPGGVIGLYNDFLNDKKTEGTVSEKTLQKYNVVKSKYLNYVEIKKLNLKLIDLDHDFYSAFIVHLRHEENLNDNTLSRYISFFKTFIRWCEHKGHETNKDYKNIKQKGYETSDIALNQDELSLLIDAKLSDKDQIIRDLFLIGVYSGQRFSDYSVFEKSDIQGDLIVKRAEKTENYSYIPLHDKLKDILEKYEWKIPRISSQKFNVKIQNICKKTGIDSEIKKTSYRGVEKTVEIIPKWKMIGSHTARRTYITLMSERGMADHFIMTVTGIKDPKTLNKYKKLNKTNLFKISGSLWA